MAVAGASEQHMEPRGASEEVLVAAKRLCQSLSLSVSVSVYLSLPLSLYLPIFVCVCVYLSVCVCLSFCLSICLCLSPRCSQRPVLQQGAGRVADRPTEGKKNPTTPPLFVFFQVWRQHDQRPSGEDT